MKVKVGIVNSGTRELILVKEVNNSSEDIVKFAVKFNHELRRRALRNINKVLTFFDLFPFIEPPGAFGCGWSADELKKALDEMYPFSEYVWTIDDLENVNYDLTTSNGLRTLFIKLPLPTTPVDTNPSLATDNPLHCAGIQDGGESMKMILKNVNLLTEELTLMKKGFIHSESANKFADEFMMNLKLAASGEMNKALTWNMLIHYIIENEFGETIKKAEETYPFQSYVWTLEDLENRKWDMIKGPKSVSLYLRLPLPKSIPPIGHKVGKTSNDLSGIDDGGDRISYGENMAVREPSEGKGRFDLISPFALARLARWYELGAKKYSDRNWERGIPFSRYLDSAMRHLNKFLMGATDEDHLAAAAWNVMAIMHHQERGEDISLGLNDLPEYINEMEKRKEMKYLCGGCSYHDLQKQRSKKSDTMSEDNAKPNLEKGDQA